MAQVVFILGAGASVSSGTPLMGNFLEVADRLRQTRQVKRYDKEFGLGYEAQFELVYRATQDLMSVNTKSYMDIKNVESLFTALEMGKLLQRFPGTDSVEQIEERIAALRTVIYVTLELTQDFGTDGGRIQVPRDYKSFAEAVQWVRQGTSPQRTVAVITFNYDMAVDIALHSVDFGLDYALPSAKTPPNSIPLLKLHGSLNWTRDKGDQKVFVWEPRSFVNHIAPYTGRHLPVGTQLFQATRTGQIKQDGREPDGPPLIVPPSWQKVGHYETIEPVWVRAADELRDAEHIFIAGYSLPPTDSFFHSLFALGIEGKTIVHSFTVVDIDDDVHKKFLALLGSPITDLPPRHVTDFSGIRQAVNDALS